MPAPGPAALTNASIVLGVPGRRVRAVVVSALEIVTKPKVVVDAEKFESPLYRRMTGIGAVAALLIAIVSDPCPLALSAIPAGPPGTTPTVPVGRTPPGPARAVMDTVNGCPTTTDVGLIVPVKTAGGLGGPVVTTRGGAVLGSVHV